MEKMKKDKEERVKKAVEDEKLAQREELRQKYFEMQR